MTTRTKLGTIFFVTALGLSMFSRSVAYGSPSQEKDDTSVNRRDRDGKTWTPQDQIKGTPEDLRLVKNIRRELTHDDSLSMYAKNVKIITTQGFVILRGPVRTPEEKEKIVALAKRHAGADRVEDSLEVVPKQ